MWLWLCVLISSRCYKASWPTVDSKIVGLHALPTSVTFSVFYANLFQASLELFTIDLFMPKKKKVRFPLPPPPTSSSTSTPTLSQCSVADARGEVLLWVEAAAGSRVNLHFEVCGLGVEEPPLHALLQSFCPRGDYAKAGDVTMTFPPHWIYLGIIGQVKLECPRAGNPISFDYWLRILHFPVSY